MRSVLLVIVVAACAPSPQGPVHAPGPPPEASPVSTAMGGSAPEPGSGWYCYEKHADGRAMSWCERTIDKCADAAEMEKLAAMQPGESFTTCAPQDRAFCNSFREQKTEREIATCHDSQAECEHVHALELDFSSRSGDGYPIAGSVTPCLDTP